MSTNTSPHPPRAKADASINMITDPNLLSPCDLDNPTPLKPVPRKEPVMSLFDVGSSQVNMQLGRTLDRMSQDLLEDGGGTTGLAKVSRWRTSEPWTIHEKLVRVIPEAEVHPAL